MKLKNNYKFHITEKDKVNVLRAFLENDNVCTINEIIRYMKYYEVKEKRIKKAEEVINLLEKSLRKTVQLRIVKLNNKTYALVYV